ncbi:MAG: hypothetical protein IIV14_03825, partial [Bacteroidaceae bacterium]|nr:hypothetical protein [Bacteroidaceae bacterium]
RMSWHFLRFSRHRSAVHPKKDFRQPKWLPEAQKFLFYFTVHLTGSSSQQGVYFYCSRPDPALEEGKCKTIIIALPYSGAALMNWEMCH